MQNHKKQKEPNLKKLLSGRSVILISNRGPVEFKRDEFGNLITKRGGGGLVTAMTAISEETRATWISAAMTDVEQAMARDDVVVGFPEDNPLYHIKLVDIPKSVYKPYYNVISNPLLWFIHHYIWNLSRAPDITAETHRAWREGYVVANKLLADAAAEESLLHINPIIMIQDYHLFLAAKYIRQQTDRAFLFHFTHIPWPEPDYMSILPYEMRTELLAGMLANDLLGFQTRHYANNFLLCCESLLGCVVNWKRKSALWQGREVYVRSYPISIDRAGLQKISVSSDVLKHETKLKKDYKDQALIVRTDRCDPSKNIIRGFLAFDILLQKHPELKEKVKFLALLYPTRENIKLYKDYRLEVESTVQKINDRHKTDSWTPIYLRIKDNYPESVAALKCYDVLLVNPIFDGMNLVSKEGPFINKRNGVLILSENAGAFSELGNSCLSINPFDVDETAEAIYKAINMPAYEKQARSASLKEIVEKNSSVKWLYYQLKDIVTIERKKSAVKAVKEVAETVER